MEDAMKYRFVSVIFSLYACIASYGYAGYYDTGFIQFRQPDGTSFMGREYGDEFIFYSETTEGNRYVRLTTGWNYYAIPSVDGDLVSSGLRVGIDAPPPAAYHAVYSGNRLTAIQNRRVEFDAQVEQSRQWFMQKLNDARTQGVSANVRLGVILVDFVDALHFVDTEHPRRPFGYSRADFDSMLFSEDHWYKPSPTPQDTSPHPENHPVFGSMRDFYWHASRPNGSAGALVVTGRVVNPQDANGVPMWIRLPDSIARYDFENVWPAARDSAIARFGLDTTLYDRFALIFPPHNHQPLRAQANH
jgi:hypothetical protein